MIEPAPRAKLAGDIESLTRAVIAGLHFGERVLPGGVVVEALEFVGVAVEVEEVELVLGVEVDEFGGGGGAEAVVRGNAHGTVHVVARFEADGFDQRGRVFQPIEQRLNPNAVGR